MTPFEQETLQQGSLNLIIQASIAVGAILVAVLAIWGDTLRNRLVGPRLRLSVQLEPPFCQRMPNGTYFRITVENKSPVAAQDVEVWVTELRRGGEPNSFRIGLISIPLRWTHTQESVAASINPNFGRYCDFGVLVDQSPQTPVLRLQTIPKPADGTTDLGSGAYNVRLAVTAANCHCRYFDFCFDVPIYWPPTEEEALKAFNLRSARRWR
jgi:hypothetical protein